MGFITVLALLGVVTGQCLGHHSCSLFSCVLGWSGAEPGDTSNRVLRLCLIPDVTVLCSFSLSEGVCLVVSYIKMLSSQQSPLALFSHSPWFVLSRCMICSSAL